MTVSVASKPQTRTFVYREDLEEGNDGWRPEFGVTLETGGGCSVAHYAIEHLADGRGTFAENLIALGRMWVLRLESGYEANHRGCGQAPSELLAEAIVDCTLSAMATPEARFILVEDGPVEARTLFHTYEQTLDRALSSAVSQLDARFAKWENADPELAKALAPENIAAFAACIHKGFRNGRYQYSGHEERVLGIFDVVRKVVDIGMPVAKLGDKLHVTFDKWTGKASVLQIPNGGKSLPIKLA